MGSDSSHGDANSVGIPSVSVEIDIHNDSHIPLYHPQKHLLYLCHLVAETLNLDCYSITWNVSSNTVLQKFLIGDLELIVLVVS